MTGVFDGSGLSWLPQGNQALSGGSLVNSGYCCTSPVVFMANGQEWSLQRLDVGPAPYTWLINYSAGGTLEPIDLVITTPEPSTLLFLSIGLLGLMGLTLLKNRLS